MWFTNNESENNWFNQSGANLSVGGSFSSHPNIDNTSLWSVDGGGSINPYGNEQEEDVVDKEDMTDGQDVPELPLGDTIDKFDSSGKFSYTHPFDEYGVPDEIKVSIRNPHCRFIKLQVEKLYNDLNFANSQKEIDKIYSNIDKMEEIQSNCN